MKNRKQSLKKLLFIFLIICITALLCLIGINLYMCNSVKDRIITIDDINDGENYDYIVVLGAKINNNNTPSHMLEDRILTGIDVYENTTDIPLLMSGDGRTSDYNEVNVMKKYAEKKGVESEMILTDRYGLSTYDSFYRLKELYGARKIIIVTQKYHLYRSLYICKSLGIEAAGISADLRTYASQPKQDAREFLARVKEFFKVIIEPQSEYITE